jgi:hypothetical protein
MDEALPRRRFLGIAPAYARLTRPPIAPPEDGCSWVQGARGVRLHFSVKVPAGEPWGVVYFVLGPEIGAKEPYPKFTEALHATGMGDRSPASARCGLLRRCAR